MRITNSKALRLETLVEGRLPVHDVERTLRGHFERYIVDGVRLVVVTGQHNDAKDSRAGCRSMVCELSRSTSECHVRAAVHW